MAKAARSFTQAKISSASVPAPIGGLNARDALANMPETDAVVLDNWFPTPTNVEVRGGSQLWSLTSGNNIETLMAYNGPITKNLFAIDSSGITDVTASGNTNLPIVTGLSNARFQYVNFGTAGGHFLSAVNGVDPAQLFDGTTWTVPTITGVSSTTFIHVNAHKSRLWYTQKDSTKAWYLPVSSIAGAATAFDFGSLFTLGGYLMGMLTWTVTSAQGMDDYAVFVSSEGQCFVYQGYDPSSTSTWQLIGSFRIGRPIGRRFYCKAGSDVILITADGVIPLSQALLTDRSQLRIALSDKIVNLIGDDVRSYAGNFGWQPILFPIGNKLLINVPQTEDNRQYQYVMNTITKAWCTFGFMDAAYAWNANCFEILNDDLYFGGYNQGTSTTNGLQGVFKADIGNVDSTFSGGSYTTISAFVKPAFSYFGAMGQQKYFTMARPIFTLQGSVYAAIAMNVDFDNNIPNINYAQIGATGGSAWDVSPWDVSPWGGDNNINKDWQTVNGIGFSGALSIAVYASTQLAWQSTDYVYQIGGIL